MASDRIGNEAPTKTIYIEQGSDWSVDFTINNPNNTPMNLTGVTFSGQLRKPALSTTLAASFVFTIVNASLGQGRVSLTAATTRALKAGEYQSVKDSIYAFDFEMIDASGKTRRWLQGPAIVYREVTR
jgi:hypothetical protein